MSKCTGGIESRGRIEGRNEFVGKFARRLKSLVDAPIERFVEPVFERRRQVGTVREWIGNGSARDLGECHRHPLLGLPNSSSRETLVYNACERPKIGAMIDSTLSAYLLGTHVRGCPEHCAFTRET